MSCKFYNLEVGDMVACWSTSSDPSKTSCIAHYIVIAKDQWETPELLKRYGEMWGQKIGQKIVPSNPLYTFYIMQKTKPYSPSSKRVGDNCVMSYKDMVNSVYSYKVHYRGQQNK